MHPCPHCGKPIEVGRQDDAWWTNQTGGSPVSLGCGTLILIAFIVMIFSGDGADSSDIQALDNHIQVLEEKIENLEVKLLSAIETANVAREN